MDFLSNYIKLIFKFCSFPSICISLVFIFIDGIATALSGGFPFKRLHINSVPKDLENSPVKTGFNNFSYNPTSEEENRELERKMYQKTKESLKRHREE